MRQVAPGFSDGCIVTRRLLARDGPLPTPHYDRGRRHGDVRAEPRHASGTVPRLGAVLRGTGAEHVAGQPALAPRDGSPDDRSAKLTSRAGGCTNAPGAGAFQGDLSHGQGAAFACFRRASNFRPGRPWLRGLLASKAQASIAAMLRSTVAQRSPKPTVQADQAPFADLIVERQPPCPAPTTKLAGSDRCDRIG